MAYSLNLRNWPLVHIQRTEFMTDMSALDNTLQALVEVLERGELHALVLDLHGVRSSAGRRQRIVKWYQTRRTKVAALVAAVAVIARSPLERGILTAFTWLLPQRIPLRAFGDERQATEWALDQWRQRALAESRHRSA